MVQFSRRTLLGGVLGAAVLGPLTACAGTGPAASGRLRVAFAAGGSKETLDPALVSLFVDQARAKALFDTLVAYNADMSLRPRLAESWESDPTGRRWRVKLRKAAFHDNKPVTAEDVLHSLRRVADPAVASSSRQYFATVDFGASRALSPTEVEFVLAAPDFEFASGLGAPGTEIVPAGTTDFTAPVGSGPFRFGSFTPGGPAVFHAWEGHWEGRPTVAELEFVPVNEEAARVNALLSGQVDYAHDLATGTAARLTGESGVSLLETRLTTMQGVALRLTEPPFSDPRLVRAVLLGVDRDELNRIALSGRGEVGNDLFGKGLRGYAADLPQRTRDVDAARALVREAGAEGLAFPLETSDIDPCFETAATLISRQLSEIGLVVTPSTRASSTYFTEIKTKGVAAHTRTATLPVPTFLKQRFRTRGSSNTNGFTSPDFDDLLDRAVATADERQRLALLAEAQRITHDRAGLLAWGFSNWTVATSKRVSGVVGAPPNTADWARFDRVTLS
ncbi:Oligopeptide ABC transporter, periplasmic oligopeptide-binding protein OppA [Actinokineospora spheciospongiae]|uniref:Oligopeptide ABC transporter, periplasmic oligopeptide-binding protein OppA n=1 Tax=Actinokineospora spheciospongiae TaxID=909613 RepID=W7IPR8_9PSEU|nr:ABC transporter substrate-binding protein [Actinokineospora spheciospongiae]EWC62398.1 Oligopeptide ABC transporter, periplasmic oligopeptide-binding protein OppA [Actinokineospora spheciospongiae]